MSLFASNAGLAQSSSQTLNGPTYSSRTIRRAEIAGIHLGMSPQSVADAMNERRFRFRNPSGIEGAGFYESDDQRIWLSVSYSENDDQPFVQSFIYHVVNYSAEQAAAIAERRSELLSLLGEPTLWTRWVNERGEIGDQFVYAPRRQLIEQLAEAQSCYANWECVSMLRDVDCRPLVRRVRVPVMQGSFGHRSLSVTVTDYADEARALLGEERFRRRDLSRTACAVPSIH